MVSDGVNIWVGNAGSGTVSKLRASDGQLLATIPVGRTPGSLAFDGENIWVSAGDDYKVVKLRVSDGAVLGSITVAQPGGLAFDGTNVWVGNNVPSGSVTKIAGTGPLTVLGVYPTDQSFSLNVAFDGTNIWAVNSGSWSVTKFRASDGAKLGTYPVGANTVGIVFDGMSIWVPSQSAVYKFRASDGILLGTFPRASNYGYPAFDGANIWIPNPDTNTVTKY
jgi:hypothetical protein